MRLCLLALTLAAAHVEARRHDDTPHKIKETIHGPPHGWHRHGPAHPNHMLELNIALPQPHFPILEQHLWEVSDPNHERYGDYLSKEETEELMAPHPDTLDVVSEWLSSHGIEEEHLSRSSAQDWVTVRVSVAVAEKMLNTEYYVYTHSDSGESIVRTTSYSLPATVHEHVELIQPTTMFSRYKPFRSTIRWESPVDVSSDSSDSSTGTILGPAGNQVDVSCKSTITINCLRQLYNAAGYETSDSNGNRIAVTGYLKQYANNGDLQKFYESENITGCTYSQVLINGGLNDQSPALAGDEANLDTQYAFGLTSPTPAIFYSTGGLPQYNPDILFPENENEPYLDWLNYTLAQEYLPQTISTSYGDNEQTVPKSYATRVCNGFATLGARGVTLLFASGDYGVGDGDSDPATQQCFTNDGRNKTEFIPSFPASCPFVTSVGATVNIPETAVSFTGGGFSNYFPRPSYQNEVVEKYLKTLAPGTYKGLFNQKGRGIPDVAAQGVNYEIFSNGEKVRISGTSAAAPTFAAIVSMLNDALICAGKKPLGFMNPWLYQKGFAALNDITEGNNPGCGTQGFSASAGWDPLTGLGTPNFNKLQKLC